MNPPDEITHTLLAAIHEIRCEYPLYGAPSAIANVTLFSKKGHQTTMCIPVTEIIENLDINLRYIVEIKLRPMVDEK
jgi:hypothetical protein